MDPQDAHAPAGGTWDFAGWGQAERITDLGKDPVQFRSIAGSDKKQLGQWRATAICGNDITSSCLYVSALAAVAAGPLAPVVLLIVAGVLFLFRRIYAEVGSALPLNGGTYTLLLNSTNKKLAAGAACLTLLSYIATAVISSNEAMHYAHGLWNGLPIVLATVGLLAFFAFLNILGITESAAVALGIFIFHMITLTVLSVACAVALVSDPGTLLQNWRVPPPGGMVHALFYGFAAAMLGISGFESSANFIEEQQSGVFPRTLRNMWLAVAIFNPLISFLSLGMIQLEDFETHKNSLLATMGAHSGGQWLASWVSVDAVLVLSGATLTSYVGVTGLVRRMSLDRCLPQFLLREGQRRKTNHWIILGFFVLCCSILLLTAGEVELLAGVYTLSFLAVMALFAIGNMLLKVVRARLPREVRASWAGVAVALAAVIVGIAGNLSVENLRVFGTYLAAVAGGVTIMFTRIYLMRFVLFMSRGVVERVLRLNEWLHEVVTAKFKQISSMSVVYFTKGDDLSTLNRAALYVLENEQTQRLQVVHVHDRDAEVPPLLAEHLRTIDQMYPQLRIDFLAVEGTFGPELIERLSRLLDVPKNYMFIGTPGDRFPHRLENLGGVRLIL